jgi:hypothetical protein
MALTALSADSTWNFARLRICKRLVNYLAFGPREPEDVRLISGLAGGGEGLPVMRQQFLDPVYRMRRDAR